MPKNAVMNTTPLARLQIDLDAVARNYLFLKKKLGAGADCAAVVKADAYGLGAAEISAVLFEQGCRHFFVAQAEEAEAVREALPASGPAGHDVSIYVLSGPQEKTGEGFIPVLNSFADIEYWAASGNRKPAVIHIDTGMNRLGLSVQDVTKLAARSDLLEKIDVRYVMSHLACADETGHAKNAEQLKVFTALTASLGRPFRYSLANSAGVFLGAGYHFDLARPGAAIYGINPAPAGINPMHPVVTLQARVLQVREAAAGSTVGYGACHALTRATRLATISAGYADGILRSLENRGRVIIAGQECPLVGRVSMDLAVVDISGVPSPVVAGDWADIISDRLTVDQIAADAGTIGYEILTGLGKRIRREYKRTA